MEARRALQAEEPRSPPGAPQERLFYPRKAQLPVADAEAVGGPAPTAPGHGPYGVSNGGGPLRSDTGGLHTSASEPRLTSKGAHWRSEAADTGSVPPPAPLTQASGSASSSASSTSSPQSRAIRPQSAAGRLGTGSTGTSSMASLISGRPKSPRCFRSLAQGAFVMNRFQAVADEGMERVVDVQGLVQRIAISLASMETYRKATTNVFKKYAVEEHQPDGTLERRLPARRLGDIYTHWHIPEDHIGLFWARWRKHAANWESKMLPSSISLEDFQAVFIKVLRRVRDRYCEHRIMKSQFVVQNPRALEEEYLTADSCGKGSFGECFFVIHRISREKRVCKRIGKEGAQVPAEEVAQELNTLKQLDHPNIVRILEWFEAEDAFLFVMEAAQGGDLKRLLATSHREEQQTAGTDSMRERQRRQRGLEETLVTTLTMQAVQALNYIHSQRVIHRDIKPANMLLATPDLERPRLLLADFGVAELFEDPGRVSSAMKGTPVYMAPEVFRNEVSPRSDIWSLGVVVFELLCGGARPWRGENAMAMFVTLKREPLRLQPLEEAGASELARRFVARLLNKEEEQRPTAAELLSKDTPEPWFAARPKGQLPGGRQMRKMKRGFENYVATSHFTRAAMNCIAAQLDTTRIEGLNEVFGSLDADHDGKLSPAELAAGLAELGADPDAIGQMLDALDVNCDGQVEYSEFVASLLGTQGQLIEEVLQHAFHIFDVNNDGTISLHELRSMLSGDGPLSAVLPDGKTVDDVLREVDTSHDGLISYQEFKAYLVREGHGMSGADAVGAQTSSAQPEDFSELPPADEESLTIIFRQLAKAVGRPEADLAAQAARLRDAHWLCTVGDVRLLEESDWARLSLPLKLERLLRRRIGIS